MTIPHLLLIDDDQDDAEIFLAALREISPNVGYSYIDNAKDALETLHAGEVRPDLIFLDLNMPQMSGQEFLKQVKSENNLKELPVIIFTTSSDPVTRQETIDAGAEGFITKPGDFYQLIDLLKPLLTKSSK
jgi:CheY-like chemotaxis protein